METEVQENERWRLELFGGLRLKRGECLLTRLETRKAAALLAYLALFPRQAHPRERLAELLWPEEDPHATLPRLRQALSAIRRALEEIGIPPERALISDRAEVRLDLRTVTTDVLDFEEALRSACQTARPAERAELLARAVDLYRGELLAGYDDGWIAAERQRLTEARIDALIALARATAETGDTPNAIEVARRAVHADPLREESHRELMRLYAAAGRAPEALRQYRELERRLREELGASPGAETRDLCRRLQSDAPDPATRPPATPPRSTAEPQRLPPVATSLPGARIEAPGATPIAKALGIAGVPVRSRRYAGFAAAAFALMALLAGLYLRPRAEQSVRPSPGQPAPLDADAESLYDRGRDAWNDRSEEGFLNAQGLFQQVIEKEPRHARAYSGLADTYSLLAYYGFIDPREAEQEAEAAVAQALRMDPASIEAHTSMAWIKMAFDWDWAGADLEFKRVTQRTPSYPTAHQWYSLYLMIQRRTQFSLNEIEKAQKLDSLSRVITKSVGQRYYHARQYEPAVQAFRKALRGDPDSSLTRYWLGLTYEQMALGYQEAGKATDAGRLFRMARDELLKAHHYSRRRPAPSIVAAIGHLHAVSGKPAAARQRLRELQALQQKRYVSPVALATIHTGLREKSQALSYLEEARRERATELILLKIEPRFDPLREEDRFMRLVQSIWSN